MSRLPGLDASFLYAETASHPNTNSLMAIVRAPDGEAITIDGWRAHVATFLPVLAALRRRLVSVPFGLHHPVLVDDPALDLRNHVVEMMVNEPDQEGLQRLFSELASTRFDHERPLWRNVLVQGLPGGGQGIAVLVHHCLMDGVAVVNLLSTLAGPLPPGAPATVTPSAPPALPTKRHLLADAVRDHARAIRTLPALRARSRASAAAVAEIERRTGVKLLRVPGDSPGTILGRERGPGRTDRRVELPFGDVLFVKRAAGVTVNDVGLAIVAGAVRGYLGARNDLPSRPLVADIPVVVEPPEQPAPGAPATHGLRTEGNRVAMFFTSLATDVEDPWERLRTIGLHTAAGKEMAKRKDHKAEWAWFDLMPPPIMRSLMRIYVRVWRRFPVRLHLGIAVSNLRGPALAWTFGTAVAEDVWTSATPADCMPLCVGLWSSAGDFAVTVTTGPGVLTCPEELDARLRAALAELRERAETEVLLAMAPARKASPAVPTSSVVSYSA